MNFLILILCIPYVYIYMYKYIGAYYTICICVYALYTKILTHHLFNLFNIIKA